MKELHLISIDKIMEGGSTKPLLITAVDNYGIADHYVVKLYKQKYVEQNFTVAKEIFIAELAEEFDLNTPDYALIDLDHNLLPPFYTDNEIEEFANGYKFCSKVQGQSAIFSSAVSLQFIKNYDIPKIFAFDNVTFNADRGGFRNKPNLLVDNDDLYLIDHEQTLPFINNSYTAPNYFNYLLQHQFQMHSFFIHLSSLRNKEGLFEEFSENVRYLNIQKFNSVFDSMDQFNVLYGERENFISYLEWLKSKNQAVCKHLENIIK